MGMITDDELATEERNIERRIEELQANLYAARGALALVVILRKRIADRAVPTEAAEAQR